MGMAGMTVTTTTTTNTNPTTNALVELEDQTYMTDMTESYGNHNKGRRSSADDLSCSNSSLSESNHSEEVKALVSRENRAVTLLKGIVLAVLICAAVVSAKLVYDAFLEKSYDAYEEEYEAVSTRLVELYRHDVLQKLWLAQNIAGEITTLMVANGWNATGTTMPDMDALVGAAVVLGPVKRVSWSPLLKTKQDVADFRAHMATSYSARHNPTETAHNHTWLEPSQLPSSPLWQQGPSSPKKFREDVALSDSSSDESDAEEETSGSEDQGRRALVESEEDESSEELEGSSSSEEEKESESEDEHEEDHIQDLMDNPIFKQSIDAMLKTRGPVMSQTYIVGPSEEVSDSIESEEDTSSSDDRRQRQRRLDSSSDSSSDDSGEPVGDGNERAMMLFFPVFDTKAKQTIVGSVGLEFVWSNYLSGYALIDSDLVREENVFDTDEVDIVLENTCGQVYTIKVDHGSFNYIGDGDLHELEDLVMGTTYEEFDANFASFGTTDDFIGTPLAGHCRYRFISYPTKDIWYEHHTNEPLVFAMCVAFIFLFASTLFVCYDCLVTRRQRIITKRAMQTNAIVSSLFPEQVRKRMYGSGSGGKQDKKWGGGGSSSIVSSTPKRRLTSYLDRTAQSDPQESAAMSPLSSTQASPIADLFPNCTVLFADIAGFTAWSSEREPSQTFKLLERTFGDFDRTAKKLGVFKVETIGDCYMAVTGLPTPREDHAVVAARFARIIAFQMQYLCKDLENSLGPSTADLSIRIGLHSGPVTGGVLRGEKSRFQLFGDTVNVASRMESTGVPGKIHISSATAEELRRFGFEGWLTTREDAPHMKGLGRMLTYFVAPHEVTSSDKTSNSCLSDAPDARELRELDSLATGRSLPKKFRRLVNWNVDLLVQHLQPVVARRQAASHTGLSSSATAPPSNASDTSNTTTDNTDSDPQVMDDMVDVLTLPAFDERVAKKLAEKGDDNGPSLSPLVVSELHDYVSCIASLYNEVPFHNFQHCSHVALSSMKLLNRIVTPEDVQAREVQESQAVSDGKSTRFFSSLKGKKGRKEKEMVDFGRAVHEATYGIGSDALMQFSILFAALIHDVDHQGVPNAQLSKEESPIATRYQHKSAAEQNSIDIALKLLRQSRYDNLRNCIAPTDDEWTRFRQLIVVAVLSTDIASAELRKKRADKWDKAFVAAPKSDDGGVQLVEETETSADGAGIVSLSNRRATAVLEQVIQASDVAHTMQHWRTYVKWNQRLFEETYRNYIMGRAEKDPVEGWYKGEIGFFDFYIIPLAKKLDTCGVFGVSKDEYLGFALANKKEWELKGKSIVEEVHRACQEKYGTVRLGSAAVTNRMEVDVDLLVEC